MVWYDVWFVNLVPDEIEGVGCEGVDHGTGWLRDITAAVKSQHLRTRVNASLHQFEQA